MDKKVADAKAKGGALLKKIKKNKNVQKAAEKAKDPEVQKKVATKGITYAINPGAAVADGLQHGVPLASKIAKQQLQGKK